MSSARPWRLLVANKFWYPKGGAETYLFELLEELPARGYTAIPFGMRHRLNAPRPHDDLFVDEVDYSRREGLLPDLRKAWRILHSVQAHRNIVALIERTRPDLAHLHNIYHQISPSILPALKDAGVPVVMTLHDLKLACPNYTMRTQGEICERCLPHRYHEAVRHRCVRGSRLASALCALEAYWHHHRGTYLRNVDAFVVPSDFYRRKMVQAGVAAEKVVWIPSFTHVERYDPAYLGSDYCLYLGRLSAEKGLLTLVEAMRGLDGGKLVVVGDGPLRTRLEETVRTSKLAHVDILGPRWGAELIELLRGARFTVIPSEWYENCPRSCIESFACGKPVIASRVGGLPEMVVDGETGLLFEPFSVDDLRNKLARLFAAEDLVVAMGRRARAKAEREYCVEAHLRKLLPVYEAVRDGDRPPAAGGGRRG
jgi:glycosyltransferase involved in cell wall biosynthesis